MKPLDLVVGGQGGSGTRLVTKILMYIGYYMDDTNQNTTCDSMTFHSLLKKINLTKESINHDAFVTFENDYSNGIVPHNDYIGFGIKESYSVLILDQVAKRYPDVKCILVFRDIFDMLAKQSELDAGYNPVFRSDIPNLPTTYKNNPLNHCKWRVNETQYVLEQATSHICKNNFLFLKYDELCNDPCKTLQIIYTFLGVSPTSKQRNDIKSIIRPTTIGRGDHLKTILDGDLLVTAQTLNNKTTTII